jgi:hypothetical protein
MFRLLTVVMSQSLVANVEYYPRTAPPPIEESRRPKLRVLYIEENLPPMGRSGAERPMVPTPFTARVSRRGEWSMITP